MLKRLLLAAAAFAAPVLSAYCNGAPSPNAKQNLFPIDTSDLVQIAQVPNGIGYMANNGTDFAFKVLHLYGSAYQMGFAHGSLFPAEVKQMSEAIYAYMVDQVAENLEFLPTWLADLIGEIGLDAALDLLIDLTKPFTGSYIYDELHGIADGSGADYDTLCRVHLIGELTQGDCSMYGASGPATLGGKTLQLRALDWDTDGPFNAHPAVIVYHPSEGLGHPFANVGFLAWIGVMTGISSQQMAVSEIGVSFPDSTHFGNESFEGIPFVYLLRDVLQFDQSYTDSVTRLETANRTCDLILGVGDGKAAEFRGFAYSASQIEVYDYTNMQPWNATNTWHPRMDHITYWGMVR
jgi:isopenicillin-N N-acyltransferase-like protein